MKRVIYIVYIIIAIITTISILGLMIVSARSKRAELSDNTGTYIDVESNNSYVENHTDTVPRILIDRIGYRPQDEKIAIFDGEGIDKTFRIVDANTLDIVYEGELVEEGLDTAKQRYIFSGNFSKVVEEGEYYVHNKTVGYSYRFAIGKGIYDELYITLIEMFKKDVSIMEGQIGRDTTKVCYMLANLLLSEEIQASGVSEVNSDAETFSEVNEAYSELDGLILQEVDWLLEIQEGDGSVIAKESSKDDALNSSISALSTAAYAGTMAKVAYHYQGYDESYSNKCLIAAENAWRYIERNEEKIPDDLMYYSQVELFRMTGSYRYRDNVNVFHDKSKEDLIISSYNFEPYGDITYLSLIKNYDKDRCAGIMSRIMARVKDITSNNVGTNYYVSREVMLGDENVLLNDIINITVGNYATPNKEYRGAVVDYLHYYLGRNSTGEIIELSEYKEWLAWFMMLREIGLR